MKTSEQTNEIYPAFFAMQKALKPIKRDKVVKTGKYEFRYAPLDSIMELLTPLFAENGLAVMQGVDSEYLTTRLVHTSGQWVESQTFLNRDHANMQGFGGEVTYKRRYALSAMVGLVADEDNDAGATKTGPRIGARSGIGADLSPDWKAYLADLADQVSALVNAGRAKEANDRIDAENLEDDQRIWMEDQMDSKVRSTLKAAKRPKQ